MKNFKPISNTRLATILLLATGVLTGAFLTADLPYSLASVEMAIDPTIPALVVVGKRPTSQAADASTGRRSHSTTTMQEDAAPRAGSAQIATAAGL